MTNITIKSFDDNSYWVNGNNISISITWNDNTNRWNVNATNAFGFDLGDGPLPDLTSAIQFIIESTPLNMGDSLDEDTMKAARMESETARWMESFKSTF